MCKQIFLKEILRALQVFLCALTSRPVCARAQLRGNIDVSESKVKPLPM